MSPRTPLLLLVLSVASLAGCGGGSDSSPAADTGLEASIADALPDATDAIADEGDAADAAETLAPIARTMTTNPLFGDTVAQNLLIDPLFEFNGEFGIGRWLAETDDAAAQYTATSSNGMMSDAPVGIAFPVGRLADATTSTKPFELAAVAQVPGGPGPFHVHVWISTLDATASATLTGVKVALVSAPDETSSLSGIPATAVDIAEDTTATKVIAGRTWHLFDGVSTGSLDLAGFLAFDFAASKNTWLLQAPEVVPTALEPSATGTLRVPSMRTLGRPRAITPQERKAIDVYRHQRTRSVPASHPSRVRKPR